MQDAPRVGHRGLTHVDPAVTVYRLRPGSAKRLIGWVMLAGLLACASCTFGADGEGGRYTARVVSVTGRTVCVGPSESSKTDTCGDVPEGFTDMPKVGQCVSLFPATRGGGKRFSWSSTSLKLKVADSECD